MRSKPKVSVIITTKNEEKYIENCLKSVKNQTLKPVDIIVTDSESDDRTVKIARKYTNKILVKKCGISEGRNMGAKMARGDILAFLDADTMLLPNTLEKVVEAYVDKRVVGASCPVLPMSADIRYVSVYMIFNALAKMSITVGKPHIAGMFCTYRKDAFIKSGGFDKECGICEDFHLSVRMRKLGKIKFVMHALALTSHRRIQKMGIRTPDRYIRAWIKFLLTNKSYSLEWYNKHMAR